MSIYLSDVPECFHTRTVELNSYEKPETFINTTRSFSESVCQPWAVEFPSPRIAARTRRNPLPALRQLSKHIDQGKNVPCLKVSAG